MKIKVSKTFQKVLAIALCMIMAFGATPLAGVIGLLPEASAEETYTITYVYYSENADGESVLTTTPVSDVEGAAVVKPAEVPDSPTRIGYTFVGWDKETPATMPAENMTITALWNINKYTITFDTDGGSTIAAIEQDYNTAITAPADPTKEGYTFAGWDTKIPAKMPANDMTIKAKWDINKYTITFNSNGGSDVASISGDYGSDIIPPANPTKTGYSFVKWEPALPATMPEGGMQTTAQWKINQYTITFVDTINPGDSNKTTPITQNYDSEIVPPEDPIREGYTFAGWDMLIPEKMPAENLTITAKWTANTVNITFDPNGGYVKDKDGNTTENAVVYPSVYNQEYNMPANPTRTGYTFLGWYADKNGKTNKIGATLQSETSETWYAIWSEGTGTSYYNVKVYTMGLDGQYTEAPESTLYTAVAGETVTATCDIKTGFKLDPAKHTKDGAVSWPTGTVTSANTAADPLELKIYVARETYTITFNADGGTVEKDSITGLYGTTLALPKDPVKTGYTFAGWKNNATNNPEILPTVMPAANTSYTALWTANTGTAYQIRIKYYDVVKNVNDTKTWTKYGTTGATVKILLDGAASDANAVYHNLSEFTLTHYEFDMSDMSQHLLESKIAADGSTVLELCFVPVDYAVKFSVSGLTVKETEVSYYTDANTVEPTDAEMADVFAKKMPGYKFTGWNPDLGNVTGDIEYVAKYEPIDYTIKFTYANVITVTNEDGTTELKPANYDITTIEFNVDDITQAYNTEVTIPAYPAKEGFKCHGWFDDDGKKYGPNDKIKMPVGGLNLTAKYEAYFYDINFDVNLDGATLKTAKVNERCDRYVTLTEDMIPAKEGYTFLGWYDYTDAENPVVYNLGGSVRVPAGGLTLVAEWAVGEFAIIFKDRTVSGEKVVETYEDIASDAPISAPDSYPTKDDLKGRTFLGWREEGKSKGDPLYDFDKMPGHSLVLVAVWGYTVTFDPNEGVLSSAETVTEEIGLEISLKDLGIMESKGYNKYAPTRTGYTFTGWYETETNQTPGDKVGYTVSYAVDTTLYAGWSINEYTLKFDAGEGAKFADGVAAEFADGSQIYTITQDYNTEIKAPANPTKVGYTFAGWDVEVPKTMPAKSMTLTAKWTINQYTFTFLDYADYKDYEEETELSAPIKQDYYSKVTAPADPVKTGYTWRYWADKDGNEVEILGTMPAHNVTYYGVWRINHCEITFNTDGGTPIATIEGDYGDAVEKPADPRKTGYTFAGWKDQNGNSVEIPDTIPAEDLELTAQWTVNQYTVTFRDSDGTIIKTERLNYGSEIVAPANPVRKGSVFKGWDIGKVPATVPAYDLIFTAVWQDNIYTITFVDTDGDVIDVVSGKYGSKVRDVEEPSKWFHKFAGWDKEVPDTMPAENMVITATWERDTGFLDFFASFFMSIFAFFTQIVNYINDFLV